jgi:3-(3-hydroxy-phenyl)propionate hydroxylase
MAGNERRGNEVAQTLDAEVAIIGYGPVGVTAANLLGRLGIRTVVIERDADVYRRARAISTDEEIIRIWQSIGLGERLKADMLSDRPIDFIGVDGRPIIRLALQPRGNGHPTQLFIYQPAVERVLRDGASRFDDVTVLLGHECTDLVQDADGVTLSAQAADGAPVRVRATYAIAADGGSSPTRTRLGVGFDGRTYEDRWLVIDTKVIRPWPEVDRLRFHCNPRRPAVDCPTPLGHHRWEFPVLPGDDEHRLVRHEAIRELLADQRIDPANVEILRAVVYSHHIRFASQWRVGRVFLAGDAAHVMPPWIGEGMASGVRDAANLSWKLAAVLRGEMPDAVLDSYEVERAPHVRRLTNAAVNFGRIITERRRTVTTIRDPLVRAAMRIPSIGGFVRSGAWFPDARVTGGLLERRPRSRNDAVGWQVPQPLVVGAHGESLLLDDALPAGWVVVVRAGAPAPEGIRGWRAAGVPVVELLPPGASPRPRAIVDTHGVLTAWLAARRATAVALRPDRYVYAAAGGDRALGAPPLRHGAVSAVRGSRTGRGGVNA